MRQIISRRTPHIRPRCLVPHPLGFLTVQPHPLSPSARGLHPQLRARMHVNKVAVANAAELAREDSGLWDQEEGGGLPTGWKSC